jgi:hypothetical protein
LLVADADDDCASGLQDLVEAQREIGYLFVRPLLLRRTLPPRWNHDVVWFGLPELVGDLHRIAPSPERDLRFWTNLLIALTVVWEAGATPRLAAELWEQLRLSRTLSLRDDGFDDWLQRQLDEYALQFALPADISLPSALAFGPMAAVDNSLWQVGAVAWQNGYFDITPLQARLWISELTDANARESLRRRRLTNVPLARWLSAWATSIEEALRVMALRFGDVQFRRFLESQPPRNRVDTRLRSRWDELTLSNDDLAVDAANFVDLALFVARSQPVNGQKTNLAGILAACRNSRNRILHARRLSAQDILQITRAVDWLSEAGVI